MSNILIVDDDVASCRTQQLHFQHQKHKVKLAHTADEGFHSCHESTPDLIILDIRMPGRSGLDALPDFKLEFPDVPVIMITAFDDMESTITAMKSGADDYIRKPIDLDELDNAVRIALERSISGENDYSMDSGTGTFSPSNTMAGRSRAMQDIFKTIGLVASKQVTVLITGESGTGKELVARAIHASGQRSEGPFVAVNCAAIVETLLESDMFGHEKGAFTGAMGRHPGKFSLAQNGTIFLDEIGDLSPAVQAKLLRVLQEKEYVPVGGQKVLQTNAHVIAATNADLKVQVRRGDFREDLYYRLQVITIEVPPLRERAEDLDDLIPHLLTKIQREIPTPSRGRNLSHKVLEILKQYSWPGNIRELENILMKLVALCPGDTITVDLLPEHMVPTTLGASSETSSVEVDITKMSLREMERIHVERVLEATGWHRGESCKILQISRPRLRRLIQQYQLQPPSQEPVRE